MSRHMPDGLAMRCNRRHFTSANAGFADRRGGSISEPVTKVEAKPAILFRSSFDESARQPVMLFPGVSVLRETNQLRVHASLAITETDDGGRHPVERSSGHEADHERPASVVIG